MCITHSSAHFPEESAALLNQALYLPLRTRLFLDLSYDQMRLTHAFVFKMKSKDLHREDKASAVSMEEAY